MTTQHKLTQWLQASLITSAIGIEKTEAELRGGRLQLTLSLKLGGKGQEKQEKVS